MQFLSIHLKLSQDQIISDKGSRTLLLTACNTPGSWCTHSRTRSLLHNGQSRHGPKCKTDYLCGLLFSGTVAPKREG